MSVSEDDVRHVAGLARLGLREESVPALVQELNGILAHMDVLQQVDLGVVSLAPDDTQGLRMRDDTPAPIPLTRQYEAFAPSMRDGFFLVPRLETHDDTSAAAPDDVAGQG